MKVIGIITLLFIGFSLYAQQDSVELKMDNPEFDFIYNELFNFNENSVFGPIILDPPSLQSNYTPKWKPLIFGLSKFNSLKTITISNSLPVFSPFVNSFSLNSYGEYQLGDKLKFGGNSFSANSIYNPLPINPDLNDMSIHGASMFLQYEVSKSVSIGGSISVTNQKNPF